jgi:hypothetical protein
VVTTPASVDLAPADPAAVPGSGPDPPVAAWVLNAAQSVAVDASGSDLVITADGVSSSRPRDTVSGVDVTGARS